MGWEPGTVVDTRFGVHPPLLCEYVALRLVTRPVQLLKQQMGLVICYFFPCPLIYLEHTMRIIFFPIPPPMCPRHSLSSSVSHIPTSFHTLLHSKS